MYSFLILFYELEYSKSFPWLYLLDNDFVGHNRVKVKNFLDIIGYYRGPLTHFTRISVHITSQKCNDSS